MSLVHKTKKEEGKKQNTKQTKKKKQKKTQKKQQIFKRKLRNDWFKMFGPHSKPILAVLAWFKADFDLFQLFRSVSTVGLYDPIQPIRPNSSQIGPVRHKSAQIGANP